MNNHSGSTRIGSPRRRRFSETQIEEFIAAFQRSGLSAAAFVRQQGLCYSVFSRWRKRRGARARPVAPRFQALPIGSLLGTAWAAEVALPNGGALRLQAGVSSEWASELLQALRRAC